MATPPRAIAFRLSTIVLGKALDMTKNKRSDRQISNEELIEGIKKIGNIMTDVSTGGTRINDVDDNYQRVFEMVIAELKRRKIDHSLSYGSLWEWYGRWSSGDLPTYQSRRSFIRDLINPLVDRIRTGQTDEPTPTGWSRVDREVGEARDRLASASTEGHFQTVGFLCWQFIISLAQAVYEPERHRPSEGPDPSSTNPKGMLDAYVAIELQGPGNKEVRKHTLSAIELANALRHRHIASFRDAALCLQASTAVVNIVAIVAGIRDPE